MKKVFTAVLSLFALLACSLFLVGCKKSEQNVSIEPVALADVKVGLICLHDDSSTYDKNFINSMKAACQALGLKDSQLEIVTGVPEGDDCKDQANKLAKTCNVIFADSFGHEDYMIEAAKENPTVRFCHATGTKAHTTALANYSNAFASIYEGRFLAGVAAGCKLNEMIEAQTITAEQAVVGYVGAFDYAEVISGYTSFYIGVKTVCPTATMKVRYTGSWYDYDLEKEATNKLINDDHCVLISQHADSLGAPDACKAAGVPNVCYNGELGAAFDSVYVAMSKIDWAPYFTYMINCVINGVRIDADWSEGLVSGAVKYSVNANASQALKDTVEDYANQIKNGTFKVFDTNNFTVKGQKITSFIADVHDRGDYVPESEVVVNGEVKESYYRSAPYFNLQIDGITKINE